MGKILLLFGWDSLFLLGLCAIAVIVLPFWCIPDWLPSLCWSIISAAIVYVATVILPRCRNMRYIKRLLLKRMERLLVCWQYLYTNIQRAHLVSEIPMKEISADKQGIPDDKEIDEVCSKMNLLVPPLAMFAYSKQDYSWNELFNQCRENIERNIHEIISINTLDNSELSSLMDEMQDAYDKFVWSMQKLINMVYSEPMTPEKTAQIGKTYEVPDSLKELAAKFRDLESMVLQYGAKRRP